jgi:hypothetical protein
MSWTHGQNLEKEYSLSLAPVDKVLAKATVYACASWIDYITDINEEAEPIAGVLKQFLFRHFQYWVAVEAMSILRKSRVTVMSVHCLHDCLQVCDSFLVVVLF